jgi:NADPH:quinone reductase-like Zn-dependent oxidoreductase
MHAIVISAREPYRYEMVQRDVPVPGPGELLLQMHAAAVNFRDLLIRNNPVSEYAGDMRGRVPLSDGVGIVVAVGEGVTVYEVGDRVSPTFFPRWLSGPPRAEAIDVALGAEKAGGTCVEFLTVAQEAVVVPPEHLSDTEAATLVCAGVTAWVALFEYGRLKPGQTVLLQGTGGVSIMALQLAAAAGARTIITSSSDEKLERAKALGANETINYKSTPEWDARVLQLTDGAGVDHIVEVGGERTLPKSVNAAGYGCSISLIGLLSGEGRDMPPNSINSKMLHVHGMYCGSRDDFVNLNRFIAQHRIRPVVSETFAMPEADRAVELLRSGRHFGKIAIDLGALE